MSTSSCIFYLLEGKRLQGWSQNGARGDTKIVPLSLANLAKWLQPWCHPRGWSLFFLNMIVKENTAPPSKVAPFSTLFLLAPHFFFVWVGGVA